MSQFTREQYNEMLGKLLPPGKAWNRTPSSNIMKLLDVQAAGLFDIDTAVCDWVNVQALPDTTCELLLEWEAVTGLPDECLVGQFEVTEAECGVLEMGDSLGDVNSISETLTKEERQANILSKLQESGTLTKQRLIDILATAGFTIEIVELQQAECGVFEMGDMIGGEELNYFFCVIHPSLSVGFAECGVLEMGDSLGDITGTDIMCIVDRNKASHSVAIYKDTAL